MAQCPTPIYVRKIGLSVPCGKCGNCLKRRISDYVVRCQEELRRSKSGFFVTLTYERDPVQLYKRDLQSFFKRLRKVGAKFSYFALGDYGDTYGRPHFHVLFFVKGFFPSEYLHSLWISGDQTRRRGFVDVKNLTVGRVAYVVRYGFLAKVDWNSSDKRVKPFFLMSKRPALGAGYLNDAVCRYHHAGGVWYYPDGRFKKPLPRYWKDKIFSKPTREVHGKLYADEMAVVIDRELRRLGPKVFYERMNSESDNYLKALRDQKSLKSKRTL